MKRFLLLLVMVCTFWSMGAMVSQSLTGVDSLMIGMPFQFTIETDFPLSEIAIPDTLTDFRVTGQEIISQGTGSIARLEIVPLRLGSLSFPKLSLKNSRLLGQGGETDAFRVFVLRGRAEGDTLIRDIKPLRQYPFQFPFWLYLLLAFLASALAIVLLIAAMRKPAIPQAQKPVVTPATPAIPAYQIALNQLDELIASGLQHKDVITYHFRLSMILREFLERSFAFGAIQMTTSEISEQLARLKPGMHREYMQVLYYADMVKFAGQEPGIEEIMRQTDFLRLCLRASGNPAHV